LPACWRRAALASPLVLDVDDGQPQELDGRVVLHNEHYGPVDVRCQQRPAQHIDVNEPVRSEHRVGEHGQDVGHVSVYLRPS
jgi:hypothetical protein